jgi:hypothetical protein
LGFPTGWSFTTQKDVCSHIIYTPPALFWRHHLGVAETWLGNTPLATQYPNLYIIAKTKNVLVADVLSHAPLNIRFNKTLTGDRWNFWVSLLRRLMHINLSDEPYSFK